MKRAITVLAFAACLPLVGCASKTVTEPLVVGDRITLEGLSNQYGEIFDSGSELKSLLFVTGMGAKDLAQTSLKSIDKNCMEQDELVYLADISGMPSLISKMVAIPKMKNYDYPILLDKEGSISAKLPAKEDQVTLVKLDQNMIQSTQFFADSITLTQALISVCSPK